MSRTYPIILIPGIARFDVLTNGVLKIDNDARDDHLHYFRNIRTHLQSNGFLVHHAKVDWAGSLVKRGKDLERELVSVLGQFQADKVHIIGHSMGGLDPRRMLYDFRGDGLPDKVATVTTIGSPHHGSAFADYLVDRLDGHNRYVEALGFSIAGLRDLTLSATQAMNLEFEGWEGTQDTVRFRTYAGKQEPLHIFSPLKFSWSVIHSEEGENDGFVSVSSAKWKDEYFVEPVLDADHLNQVGWWDISEVWHGVGPLELERRIKKLYLDICEELAAHFHL